MGLFTLEEGCAPVSSSILSVLEGRGRREGLGLGPKRISTFLSVSVCQNGGRNRV